MNFFIFFLIIIPVLAYGAGNNLMSVLLVYRHGARTPKDFPPNDYYKDLKYWSSEPGELTNRGKQQHYILGDWLRKRYSGFLPEHYYRKDIYVRSTAIDRCLMSAEVNLAGLYPPTNNQIWSPTIKWMPIPVHSVPVKEDNLLRMGRACPTFQKKYVELLNNDNFTEIDKSNEEFYKYLSVHLGEEIKKFSEIEPHFDTMSIELENNMALPKWTQDIWPNGKRVFPEEMKKWADLSYVTPTYTTELARLGTGRFFDTLAGHFEAVDKNDTENMLARKMVMFSAHKSTLGDLTHTLGVFKLAPYAGVLIFELRKNPNSHKSYVNTLYRSGNDLEHLQLKGCEADCDLNIFLDILKPYRLSEKQWEIECLSGAVSRIIISTSTIISTAFGLTLYNLNLYY